MRRRQRLWLFTIRIVYVNNESICMFFGDIAFSVTSCNLEVILFDFNNAKCFKNIGSLSIFLKAELITLTMLFFMWTFWNQ